MKIKTKGKEPRNVFAVVKEMRATFTESKEIGTLLNLEELPKFISEGGIKLLENTDHYRERGWVSFFIDVVGMNMHGFFRFNTEGKTVDEMFIPISKNEYFKLPFNERARFWRGILPLSVELGRSPDFNGWRLGIGGVKPDVVAPVVVVKQQHNEVSLLRKP
jgi:hypothetical protein